MKSFIVGSLREKKNITCRDWLGSVCVVIFKRYFISNDICNFKNAVVTLTINNYIQLFFTCIFSDHLIL